MPLMLTDPHVVKWREIPEDTWSVCSQWHLEENIDPQTTSHELIKHAALLCVLFNHPPPNTAWGNLNRKYSLTN